MFCQIEPVKTKKNKTLIIVYILILLLVLLISSAIAIFVIQLVKGNGTNVFGEQKTQEVSAVKNNEEDILVIKPAKTSEQFFNNVEEIYNGKEGKRVFLTFDDGPSRSVTPHILDVLKQNNVKATFFVLGERVKNNADIIKREYEEGHYIANHGYTHKYSKIYSSIKAILDEYNKTEEEIRKALNMPEYSSNLFRFPGGSVGGEYSKIKKNAKKELKKKNIAYLDWNALTNDSNGANTKEKIMKNLKETVEGKDNVVLLMHDAPDKILTYETLNDVIKYLKEKGYEFKNFYDIN